jgi:hypothetical protein
VSLWCIFFHHKGTKGTEFFFVCSVTLWCIFSHHKDTKGTEVLCVLCDSVVHFFTTLRQRSGQAPARRARRFFVCTSTCSVHRSVTLWCIFFHHPTTALRAGSGTRGTEFFLCALCGFAVHFFSPLRRRGRRGFLPSIQILKPPHTLYFQLYTSLPPVLQPPL